MSERYDMADLELLRVIIEHKKSKPRTINIDRMPMFKGMGTYLMTMKKVLCVFLEALGAGSRVGVCCLPRSKMDLYML
jgi:hypothetical protein